MESAIVRLSGITSKINKTNQQINESIKLLEIREVTESFMKLRDQLSEVSVKTNASGWIGKAKQLSVLGSMIKKSEDALFSMNSVYSTLDSLFKTVESKYEKLLDSGTKLQQGKALLESQIEELLCLEYDIGKEIEAFENPEDIPLHLVSAQTQIGTYVIKYKSRLMNVQASLFATKETIQQLGVYLPTFKSELNDELALSGLLTQVSDYQSMFHNLSKLVKELGDINDLKTQASIENLLDLQINDTTTRDVLLSLKTRSATFSASLVKKAEQLQNKILDDNGFYKQMHSDGLILSSINKVKSLIK